MITSERAFHRLNRNLIIAHMTIALATQPLCAYYTHAPIGRTLATVGVSSALVILVYSVKALGLVRIRTPLLTVSLACVSMGLYQLNGGIFGTSLEPALLSFGTAGLIAVDGTLVSLLIGIACGWVFSLTGKLFFTDFYFGSDFDSSWMRTGAHMVWWSLAVVSGYVLGLGVHRIIQDLEVSRSSIETVRTNERHIRDAAEHAHRINAATRTKTLDGLSHTFDAWMQTAVRAVTQASLAISQEAASTREMAVTTEQVSEAVATLAQAASLKTEIVATGALDLSESIDHARQQITVAAAATAGAVASVRESNEALRRLEESGRKIGDIAALIDHIASRTHLLALNASIEAARAGEDGRGFAVVATEVKHLAGRTSRATSEVGTLVSGMQAALKDMVVANHLLGDSVTVANGHALSVSRIMDSQSTATARIAKTVSAVAKGTHYAFTRMAEAATNARLTVCTAEAMQNGVAVLNKDAVALQHEASRFVAELRAS